MNERSLLRLQLAATLVGNLVARPNRPEAVEGKLLAALGLADRLIALQEAQDKADSTALPAAQVAAFTTLGAP
jgi:hypothetical protein